MRFVRWFSDVGLPDVGLVGGKNASLGEMIRSLAPLGVRVPDGFAITAEAYRHFLHEAGIDGEIRELLSGLKREDVHDLVDRSAKIRGLITSAELPAGLREETLAAYRELSARCSVDSADVAVRSSATAEDLPGASFAGQQDTYLNVRGEGTLLDAVKRCWISLFTDRAVLYRARSGFGHRGVRLSVVVQRLIDPEVSGILFTADPISGHRHIASIDAGFGLGEALVSGLISADLYRVDRRSREVLLARPGSKDFAIRSVPGGGTRREILPEPQRSARALNDDQVR